jgi:putative spermidine/putrescine transport system ATP-binding protein
VYNRPASLRVARLMGGLNEITGEVRDGAHHSALGRVELDAARDSAKVQSDGSAADGRTGDGRAADAAEADGPEADGPAVLVVRQEAVGVRLLDAELTAGPAGEMASAAGGSTADPRGTVTGIRQLGPRRTLTIGFERDGARAELQAELPPGRGVALGSTVAVHVPRASVSVVRA